MGDEGDIEIARRSIRRTMELIEHQEHQVDSLRGNPEQKHAEELLRQLQKRLEIYRQHLTDLVRRSG